MQINTDYVTQLLGSIASSATGPTSSASSTSTSLFGPSALLSLGTESSGSAYGYSNLQSVPPQFDLTGVLEAKNTAATSQPQVSPAVQEREASGLQQVSDLVEAGQLDDARQIVEELRADNPTSGPLTQALGVIELEQGHYETAERYFLWANALAPDRGYDQDADVAKQLQKDDAQVFAVTKSMVTSADTLTEGRQLLIGLTQRSPQNTEARLLLGETLLKEQNGTGALLQYRLAIVTADRGQLEGIEQRLSELVDAAPKAAYVRQLLGQTQLRLGQNEQAAQTLAAATELSNGDPSYRAAEAPAQLAIGREQLDRGDIAGALASFQQAQNLDYSNPGVRAALGEAYLTRGEQRSHSGALSGAVADFNTALSKLRNSSDTALRTRLAQAAYTVGVRLESRHTRTGERVGDESVAYDVALELDPDNAMYQAKVAQISSRVGDEFLADGQYRNAAYAYQRAYDLLPDNETYKNSTVDAFARYGDEQASRHQYDAAITAYSSAYEIGRGDAARLKLAGAYNSRGLVFLDEGKLRQARADFLRAARLDPNNDDYQRNYNSVP